MVSDVNDLFLEDDNKNKNNDLIVAKIKGEDAKRLLTELNNGSGIHFRVSGEDEDGLGDPIIYLYKA